MSINNRALLTHYQELMELAGYIIFTTDADATILHISQSVELLTGYTSEDLIHKPFTSIVDPQWHASVENHFSKIGESDTVSSLELPIITKSGERRWIEQTVMRIDDNTEVSFQAICQDITTRKQEQIRYHALFEQNNDAIFILDLEGRHVAVNKRASDLFGYSQEQLLTMSYHDLVMDEDLTSSDDRLKQIIAGKKLPIYERKFKYKNGTTIHAEINTQLVYDANNNPLHIQSIVRDITARKRAEQEIINREMLYRTIARHLPKSAILIYDRDLRYLLAEGQALEQTGYHRERVEGATIDEVLLPETATTLAPMYRKAFAGEEQRFEYQVEDSYYDVQILPVFTDTQEIFAGMLVIQDVTGAKLQRDALEKSEARVRAMLKAIPDFMFVLKQDGTYVDFVNNEKALAENVRDFDFDDAVAETIKDALNKALTTGEVQHYMYEPPAPDLDDDIDDDADLSAYEARVVALNADEALFMVRNTSDLKQTQAELSARIEQLTILHQFDEELADHLDIDYVLNIALDASLRLSHADSGYIGLQEENSNMFSLAKVAGDHIFHIADDNLRKSTGAVSRIIRNRRAELIPDVSVDPDYIINRPQTKSQITVPLLSQNQQLIGVLNLESNRFGVFTEDIFSFIKIIARRISAAIENARLYQQVEQQLKHSRALYERIRSLEQLKTDMIRIASHDLRNPLATVLGYAEMSKYEVEGQDNDVVEYIDLIYQSARKMQKIIIDILSLERIEELAEETEKREFRINQLVQSVYGDSEPHARIYGKKLILQMVKEKVETFGDPIQIREAITNLVNNAIKYTNEDGEITLSLLIRDQKVVVEVVDNGQGIREDQQERLFQPFYRARTEENATVEGTGLGLHLVKNIIERHDGEMIFKSVYGEGSTFGFSLPLKT